MKIRSCYILIILLFLFGCRKDTPGDNQLKNVSIFFVNDVHGQIDNFSKVKHIIEQEKQKNAVVVVSSGDCFSGNPVVDNHAEKGFPIIDIMNKIGFNASVLGNHEFDYGSEALKARINQSQFPWILANMEVKNMNFPAPPPFATVNTGNLKITFIGLVETNGKSGETIPSSHPWKLGDFYFKPASLVVSGYSGLKRTEGSDLIIALSHLGHNSYGTAIGDLQLAKDHNWLDMIIGGHSHAFIDTVIAGVPIYQSGSYLNYLGKIEISAKFGKISSSKLTLIDLSGYTEHDMQLKSDIENYNNQPHLKQVIGNSEKFHYRNDVGCFYTDAMRQQMKADLVFQNTGGIRSTLNEGDITVREIFEISPFNNGTIIYNMTVAEVKNFLIGSGSGFYYSGVIIEKIGGTIIIKDLEGNNLPDEQLLKVGTNDYIPAVHDNWFPQNGIPQPLTDAETIIEFLKTNSESVAYNGCNRYFRF